MNKILGPSNIPAWAQKSFVSVIAEFLCFPKIAFFNEGKFPSDFKQAHACLTFRKGETENPNNYRPISTTATLSNVFEKSLVNK